MGGLFGGGGQSQTQKQQQDQNQNQNQSQNANANASSNSSAYNNLTINYPNESAGMALQGLLGAAGAPFNPIGAPGVEQETGDFAPQAGYQAPGLVPIAAAAPAYSPAGSAFVGGAPGGGGGAAPAMAAPNMPPPSQPQVFAAGPNGGSFGPGAAAGALQAAQQFAPSGSAMVAQQAPQLIANAPANPGSAYGSAPNPFAPPPMVTDATNAQAMGMPPTAPQRGGAGGADASGGTGAAQPDTQSLLPPLEGLKATEAPSPFATVKQRKNETPQQANEPVTGNSAELYQIPAKLPADLKAKLRAEYNALDDIPKQIADQIVQGTGMKRSEYQADLVQQIKDADNSLREVASLTRKHSQLAARAVERELQRDANELGDTNRSPDDNVRGLAGRAAALIDETNERSMQNIRGALRGRSLQYSGSDTHGQDILENKKFLYRVGNLLNPQRVRDAQSYVNNTHAEFIKRAQASTPDILRQEEMIDKHHEQARDYLMKTLTQQVQVAKQQQLTAGRALNRDRILEANLTQMRRQDIFKNIRDDISQSNQMDRQADLNSYRALETNLHKLEFEFDKTMKTRNAEDREAQIQINLATEQMYEQRLPSDIQRNMSMGQGMFPGQETKTYFDQPMQFQQQNRQQALQGAIQGNPHMKGLIPPPPATEPGPGTLGPGVPAPGLAGMRQSLKAQVVAGTLTAPQAAAILQAAVQAGVK